ncbi:hypothetical protein DH2020_032220 [Rehmannia glutinosa]|uniref:HHO5-like N-terminal domain-containing protein n=1 Tax=Rehmannia glutinosa TaxID=99300 RepID=A0ABR0VI99_REHGL
MMINGHNHGDFPEKMQRCHDYIRALEEERTKIQVFQRELPLCLELVTQAIETCKQQLPTTEYNLNDSSESCEQTSSDAPVFEEFMPMKRASSHSNSDGEQEQESKKAKNENITCNKDENNCNDKNSKKSDWLRSVQLWNQTPDPPSKDDSPRKSAVVEVNRNGSGGAFHPFKKEKEKSVGGGCTTTAPANGAAPPPSTSSTADTGGSGGGGNKKEEKEGQSKRKARRCWSPELHKRFLQALQQLGGSHGRQAWDEGLIAQIFNKEEANDILEYPLRNLTCEDQYLLWHYTPSGNIVLSQGYKIALKWTISPNDPLIIGRPYGGVEVAMEA